jgi:SAM-dependent methyltransferase
MSSPPKPDDPPPGLQRSLLGAVAPTAHRILDVACGEGALGAALKARDAHRQVFGIERDPAVAARAAPRLDRVFTLDIEEGDPPLEPGSLDCVVYGDVLPRLLDPGAVLRRYRRLVAPGGDILCAIPNVQHHSLVSALCTGDFQYTPGGLLDPAQLRLFSRSTFIKLLLDCGYAPTLHEILSRPFPPGWWDAVQPLLRHFRLDPERMRRYLGASRYVFRGTPFTLTEAGDPVLPSGEVDHRAEPPLTFVVCVADEATLRANLLSSPCFRPGSPHEVLLMGNCRSAAEGLNAGRARARHDWVVCVHQDVYLPAGWPSRFARQCRLALEKHGRVGVCGVMGVEGVGDAKRWVAHVVHQDRLLDAGRLPAPAEALDELLLALPRGSPLAFDLALGFHFYGTDVCLAARAQGLPVLALDALCYHNTRSNAYPPEFFTSAAAFARKWSAALPLSTPCATVSRDGTVSFP